MAVGNHARAGWERHPAITRLSTSINFSRFWVLAVCSRTSKSETPDQSRVVGARLLPKKPTYSAPHNVVRMALDEETVRTVHEDDGRGIGWFLERGPLTCAAAVMVLSVVKYGAGLYPSWRYMQQMAQHWQHPLQAALFSHVHARYLLDSPVSAEIAGIVHLTSAREYLAFHLLLACAAVVIPFSLGAVRRSAELRLGVALAACGRDSSRPAAVLGRVVRPSQRRVRCRGRPGVQSCGPSLGLDGLRFQQRT